MSIPTKTFGIPCQIFLVIDTDGKIHPQKIRYKDPKTEELQTVQVLYVEHTEVYGTYLIYYDCVGKREDYDLSFRIRLTCQVIEHKWFVKPRK